MVPKANGPKFPQGTMVPLSKWTQIQKENEPKFPWNDGSPREMGLSSLWNDGSPGEMDPSS
jgi:hypothetical protein